MFGCEQARIAVPASSRAGVTNTAILAKVSHRHGSRGRDLLLQARESTSLDWSQLRMIPSTSYQLLVLVGLVLPGIVFGSVLQRLRGPIPEDKDASTRILRAIAVGAGFDIAYVLLFGPQLVDVVRHAPTFPGGPSGVAASPREVALWTLLLAGVIPSLTALLIHIKANFRVDPPNKPFKLRLKHALRTTYRTTPTAWDYIARARGGCFVRIRLGDGKFIGGWVTEESFVSGYPEPRDIFIASQWAVDERGVFLRKIEGTLGVYVPLADNTVVEWLAKPVSENVSSVESKELEGVRQ